MEGADTKGRSDFVSRADLEAQEAALAVIRERHPGDRVMAEEDDPDVAALLDGAGDTPVWVVDPLDGTTNFLHAHPMYAASVAAAVRGRPVAGAVVCPQTGERWWASRNGGAWKNGLRLEVSSLADPAEALVGTGFPFKRLDLLDDYLRQLGRMLRRTGGVRRGGAAAIDLCYLAEGRFDGFWELFLNPWDFAAGMLVVEEAGGVMERPDGSPLELTPGGVLGANGLAMRDALRAVVTLEQLDA
jgi:myo-inositol-1(or 4)-monophosphatase